MLTKFRNKWKLWVWGNHVHVVRLHILENGSIDRTDAFFSIKNSDLKPVEGLADQSGLPVIVVFTGKGIISKTIARNKGSESVDIQNALEGYQSTELLYTDTLEENRIHLDIIRNDQAKELISHSELETSKIVHVSIGYHSVWEIKPFFGSAEKLNVGNAELSFDANGITGISKSDIFPPIYDFDGDHIEGSQLVHLASAMSFLKSVFSGSEKETGLEEFYGRAIKKMGLVGLAAAFAVLLVNALVFMNLQSKHDRLSTELQGHLAKVSQLERLERDVQIRTELLARSGGDLHGKYASLIDRIGTTVPTSINLNSLEIHPLKERRFDSDPIEIEAKSVLVKGQSASSTDLDSWISELQSVRGIERVEIEGFTQEDPGKENTFSLNLILP